MIILTKIKKVAVIGAGVMGHGIAQVFAMTGYDVWMRDIAKEILDKAMSRIRSSLERFAKKGRLKESVETILSRIHPTLSMEEAVKDADFIIEAVPEKLDLKKKVFAEVDSLAPPHAIIATNTSSLSITEIASATKRPDKCIGMHFFNPPQILKLVEVVKGEKTSDETVKAVMDLARKLGKEPVLVKKDVGGFIVNRILFALLNEAAWFVYKKEGTVIAVDSALIHKTELPMGAFWLADFIGLDVCWDILVALKKRDLKIEPCPLFKEYVDKGLLGVKSGKGFYDYTVSKRPSIPAEAGADIDPKIFFAPAINVAAWLLRNDVASLEDIEKAVKLGLNWPRGIFEYADEWGIDRIVEILKARGYEPDPLLVNMVQKNKLGLKTGEGFYKHDVEIQNFGKVILRREGSIAWVTLNRPEKLNAIDMEMLEQLEKAIDLIEKDERIRVVIITGVGKAFCAGVDVSTFKNMSPMDAFKFSRRLHKLYDRIEKMPKPFVCIINGYALGGGCELALACDIRIGAKSAGLGQPEINLGIIPGAGATQRLVKLIGLGRAKELMMTGRIVSAIEAAKMGLLNRVVPDTLLEDEARALAKSIADKPPIAIAIIKYVANEGEGIPKEIGEYLEALGFGLVFSTEDAKEGINAFLEKRKPKFKGK